MPVVLSVPDKGNKSYRSGVVVMVVAADGGGGRFRWCFDSAYGGCLVTRLSVVDRVWFPQGIKWSHILTEEQVVRGR